MREWSVAIQLANAMYLCVCVFVCVRVTVLCDYVVCVTVLCDYVVLCDCVTVCVCVCPGVERTPSRPGSCCLCLWTCRVTLSCWPSPPVWSESQWLAASWTHAA